MDRQIPKTLTRRCMVRVLMPNDLAARLRHPSDCRSARRIASVSISASVMLERISGLAFPQDLILAPDGNGFLVGVLGFAEGAGNISRYSFDGSFLGTFASAGVGGFTEATAFALVPALVPEPSSFVLIAVAFGSVVAFKRRRSS